MYQYNEFDSTFVHQRVNQFRGQVARRLSGELSEDQFKPLRLMNGLYLQLHAYMLRVAIPYGVFSSHQMRKLAEVARTYDKGYGHFTTRQNIQYNWPKLEQVPDLLLDLAEVDMHAIQTSGNCIRNTTTDPYAGVAADEIEDPRVYCEMIRQWSTLHPEFAFLPRKFKIAVTGAREDRAATRYHDIGLILHKNDEGETGFEVLVGGGQGRTPLIAKTIRKFLPKQYLLSYLEAVLRVYNLEGRRDNKYKARIKILVHETGIEALAEKVEREWSAIKDSYVDLPAPQVERIRSFFAPPEYHSVPDEDERLYQVQRFENHEFRRWSDVNLVAHRQPGYAIVNLSLKPVDGIPGDISASQMDAVADLADQYGFGEIRSTLEQNLVLPDVLKKDLFALWQKLTTLGLATPNINLITDIIACPGLDYCALANARSIPVAAEITRMFADPQYQQHIGELGLKISGCINACGHHHVGHIGILGVDRRGEEYYQITLGGVPGNEAAIGKVIGPAFSYSEIAGAVETIVKIFLAIRHENERFIETLKRVGEQPFKLGLYGDDKNVAA